MTRPATAGSGTDRLAELLTEQTDRTLTTAERREVDVLLTAHPDWSRHDLDRAAAAVFVGLDADAQAQLPKAMERRLIEAADRFSKQPRLALLQGGGVPREEVAPAVAPNARMWKLATFAALVLAAVSLASVWTRAPSTAPAVATAPVVAQRIATPDNVADARAGLLATEGTGQWAWTQGGDPLGLEVAGDVVWHTGAQRGYISFDALPMNDPETSQYQLWIFDAERPDPVDGGVFDVASGGHAVIPFHAALSVSRPTLFAVTLERPGGVVVSKRERVIVVAKPPAG